MKQINVNVTNMRLLSAVIHNIYGAAQRHSGVTVVIKCDDLEGPVGPLIAKAMEEQAKVDAEAAEAETARLKEAAKVARDKVNAEAAAAAEREALAHQGKDADKDDDDDDGDDDVEEVEEDKGDDDGDGDGDGDGERLL